jgi:hypothetical protein
VLELGVAIGMLLPFDGLARALQAVVMLAKQPRDRSCADRVPTRREFVCEFARALARPAKCGDSGSPRVSGSTSASSSDHSVGSPSSIGLRPPPGRRTRCSRGLPTSGTRCKPSRSLRPRQMRLLAHSGLSNVHDVASLFRFTNP